MKNWLGTFLVAASGAAIGYGAMRMAIPDHPSTLLTPEKGLKVVQADYLVPPRSAMGAPDFVQAASAATPAVVHIKSLYAVDPRQEQMGKLFGMPYHEGLQPQSSGSGVIISNDGYIATNNHVVKKAEKIEVTLNDKRSFVAEVIGTDPTTDLALIKIDAGELPFLTFSNSDQVQVGEWALAVGNPFNLTSTVTAGIVSAKGRSLNLLREELAIESFIQTDAAVNPGNSGGALINTSGQLIGINTAIASETGSYEGYSFAVPANIVRKVMEDLMEYGKVKRGIIGVQIRTINAQFAEEEGLSVLNGAYVVSTIANGAAADAGIKSGDVITSVAGRPVGTGNDLQGIVGTYRPGDKVKLEVMRGTEQMTFDVVLRDPEGRTEIARNESDDSPAPGAANLYGAKMEPISTADANKFQIEQGVRVSDVGNGKLKAAGIPSGFIVTKINKQRVAKPEDVARYVMASDGSVLVEGYLPDGKPKFYAIEK
jgi:Do/DeqQ family serine protease